MSNLYVQCSDCGASLPSYLADHPELVHLCPVCKSTNRHAVEGPPQRRTITPSQPPVARVETEPAAESRPAPPQLQLPEEPGERTAAASIAVDIAAEAPPLRPAAGSRFDFTTPLLEDLTSLLFLAIRRTLERSLLFSVVLNAPLWDLVRLIAGAPVSSGGKK